MKPRKTAKQAPPALTPAILKQNAILNGLEAAQVAEILKRGKLVYLETRAPIYEAEETIREAYFPIDCVLSVVTQMKEDRKSTRLNSSHS